MLATPSLIPPKKGLLADIDVAFDVGDELRNAVRVKVRPRFVQAELQPDDWYRVCDFMNFGHFD